MQQSLLVLVAAVSLVIGVLSGTAGTLILQEPRTVVIHNDTAAQNEVRRLTAKSDLLEKLWVESDNDIMDLRTIISLLPQSATSPLADSILAGCQVAHCRTQSRVLTLQDGTAAYVYTGLKQGSVCGPSLKMPKNILWSRRNNESWIQENDFNEGMSHCIENLLLRTKQ